MGYYLCLEDFLSESSKTLTTFNFVLFLRKIKTGPIQFQWTNWSSVARYIFIKVVTQSHVQAGQIKKKIAKLNDTIDLKSSLSFNRSFNILAKGKSTKTAQYACNQLKHLIILHLPSHVCNIWLMGDGRKCTLICTTFFGQSLLWLVNPPTNVTAFLICILVERWRSLERVFWTMPVISGNILTRVLESRIKL